MEAGSTVVVRVQRRKVKVAGIDEVVEIQIFQRGLSDGSSISHREPALRLFKIEGIDFLAADIMHEQG